MAMDALELLDFDCWRLVFRKLNADDLMSCRQVCRPLPLLLDEQEFQLKWKFDLILPLVFDHFESRDDSGLLSWRDLHSIRLVCQSWRQSVDKYVSEIYEPTDCPQLLLRHYPLATNFFSPEQIGEFHQKFDGCRGSPFPAKNVFIQNGRFRERAEGEENAVIGLQTAYITKLTNFMADFGCNILKLQFYLDLGHYYMDYLFVCKLLKGITAHLPNLLTLRVASCNCMYYGQRDDPEEMTTWIGENALSDLPKLKTLELEGLDDATENYLVEKYAPRLIHFRGKYDLSKDILQQPQLQLFRNLSKLSLELADNMDTLETLRFLESPLKLLTLSISCGFDDEPPEPLTWNVDEAMRNVQHLPIERLEMTVYAYVNVVEADLEVEDYINQSIQTLSIHFQHFGEDESGEISFNFLQALRKLENLEFKIETSEGAITHPEGVPEVVKLNEFVMVETEEETEAPYESNVWEMVPSLKTLKVTKDGFMDHVKATYTREEYDRIKKSEE